MVPSDSRSNPAPRRHARPKPWQTELRDVVFPAPRLPCCRETDQRLKARLPLVLLGACASNQTFRSPAAAARCQVAAARSSFPACFFDTLLKLCRTRSAPRFPARSGLPRTGRVPRIGPVARLCPGILCGCGLSTPRNGVFTPATDRSVAPARRRKAHLCDLPDFPSLPAGFPLLTIRLRIIVPGSLLLTRLDCSVNLLEPKPSCLGTPLASNTFVTLRCVFLNIFLV